MFEHQPKIYRVSLIPQINGEGVMNIPEVLLKICKEIMDPCLSHIIMSFEDHCLILEPIYTENEVSRFKFCNED